MAKTRIVPVPKRSTRKEPIVDYLVETYTGHPALPTVALQVAQMLDLKVNVTTDIVDSLVLSAQGDWLTQRRLSRQEAIAAARQLRGTQGYTYFLRNGDRIKIGFSRNPKARAVSLSLRESDILGVVPSQQKFERRCHETWEDIRIGNTEWFHATDELLEWIGGIAQKWHYKHPSRQVSSEPSNNYEALLHAIRRAP